MTAAELSEQPAYASDIPLEFRYRAVATLADESRGLTCSVAVASKHFRGLARELRGFSSSNKLVADHHGLRTLRVLAAGEAVAFIIFERNGS